MSGREGGKKKPLKQPKKQSKDLDEFLPEKGKKITLQSHEFPTQFKMINFTLDKWNRKTPGVLEMLSRS